MSFFFKIKNGLNLLPGPAPVSPVDGDVWMDPALGLMTRVAGSTNPAGSTYSADNVTLALFGTVFSVANGGISNTQIASAASISLTKLAALTANRLVITDGSGFLTSSTVTTTEQSYLSGVTSAIQTQLDGKQASLPSQTGNAGKVLQTDGTNLSWQTPSGGGVTQTANYHTTKITGLTTTATDYYLWYVKTGRSLTVCIDGWYGTKSGNGNIFFTTPLPVGMRPQNANQDYYLRATVNSVATIIRVTITTGGYIMFYKNDTGGSWTDGDTASFDQSGFFVTYMTDS